MAWLNLASWLSCTEVEGPGRRAALWVQGCDKRCNGCCNPDYLKIVERQLVDVSAVLASLLRAHDECELEGITLLGGEPFLQALGLAEVAEGASRAGLSVMTFTGYTMEELQSLSLPGTQELLTWTDVLVDGPYQSALPDQKRNWVGSTNQRFHYLSSRYSPEIETRQGVTRGLELRVRNDGHIVVNGWPVVIR